MHTFPGNLVAIGCAIVYLCIITSYLKGGDILGISLTPDVARRIVQCQHLIPALNAWAARA